LLQLFFKQKIDVEMAKINVEVGVYLPSSPDGKVVDIDRKSGRPLQSHAKVGDAISNMLGTYCLTGSFYGNIQSAKGTC